MNALEDYKIANLRKSVPLSLLKDNKSVKYTEKEAKAATTIN